MFLNTDWIEVGDTVVRALLSLITLFLITKLLGKKQVSQLSVFDYVIGISIGNFAAEMTINVESQYMNGIVAVVVFGVVAYLISIWTMKSIIIRRFFMGVPTLLIQNGKLIEKNLKKVKLDMNDLLEECRSNGYFDISEIEYAIMEANGTLSILPKGEFKPLTVKDMNLKPQKQGLCANVIIDGKIMYNNLEHINKNEKWILKELKVRGQEIGDILLGTVDINDKLVLFSRNNNEQKFDVLE